MNLYTQFKTNEKFESGGVWFKVSDVSFLIKRISPRNHKYKTTLSNLLRPHKRALESDTLPDELSREISMTAFMEGCLLDWENVKGSDGVLIPYSKDSANKLFKDLPDLFDLLLAEAQNANNFIEAQEIAKN